MSWQNSQEADRILGFLEMGPLCIMVLKRVGEIPMKAIDRLGGYKNIRVVGFN